MHHKGTIELRTPRLLLRRFTPEDAQAMFDTWAYDSRVTRYLTWLPHGSPVFTRELLENWCASYERPEVYNWAIEYKGMPVGNISVVRMDETDGYAELGYCLGTAYWNTGIMTEAASAVIDFLFSEVGAGRVGISHAVENPASGRVALKCGLTFEGTRQAAYRTSDGALHDLNVYGIRRDAWVSGRSL